MAQENRSWGYDRLAGALQHLGYTISAQSVGNILKRHGIPPAPERKTTTTWTEFIRTHMDVLVATDFFTAEVWTAWGLVTYYVLFFIHPSSRKVHVAGITPHPNEAWMRQIARNVTMEEWGFLASGHYLIHDRDGKYCPAFQHIIDAAGVKRVPLPPRSPNLNAYAERWARSVQDEALSRLILFDEATLRPGVQYQITGMRHSASCVIPRVKACSNILTKRPGVSKKLPIGKPCQPFDGTWQLPILPPERGCPHGTNGHLALLLGHLDYTTCLDIVDRLLEDMLKGFRRINRALVSQENVYGVQALGKVRLALGRIAMTLHLRY